MANNPRCWVVCLECGHRDMIRRPQLMRASRVRCQHCGGMVEPSAEAAAALANGAGLAAEAKREDKNTDTERRKP